MSTNSNCSFLEVKKGEWYYILEDFNAPKNAWDWREYATAYGPFRDFDTAHQHLHDHHANPGGYSTGALPAGVAELDLSADSQKVLRDLITQAVNPRQQGATSWRRW